MRVLLASLLISTAAAIDSVIFSNEQKITNEYPSVENLLSTATAEAPVVFFVNPDFTLGQFSQHVNAYSDEKIELTGLPGSVKTAKYNTARFLDSGVHTPSAVEVTSADNFKAGSPIYIVSGENWSTLDALAQKIIPSLGSKFTGIITETEAVSKDHTRVKRVTMNQAAKAASVRGDAALQGQAFPIVIPPYYNVSSPATRSDAFGSCLFYSEGVNIVVYSKGGSQKSGAYATAEIRATNATWDFDNSDVKCENNSTGNYTFNIRITTKTDIPGYTGGNIKDPVFTLPAQSFTYQLIIQGDNIGYWQLISATAKGIQVNPVGTTFLDKAISLSDTTSAITVDYIGLNSVQGWAWGCYSSQALFFPPIKPDDVSKPVYNYLIGVSLYNTEIQPLGAISNDTQATPAHVKFTLNMDDCTGTFSVGSWMGIIGSVVLLFGLFFGYIMLQAVKTMDRFDDPKQKQILINVRE